MIVSKNFMINKVTMANFKEKLQHIKAFVFDVDGVFTDGKLYLFPETDFVRSVNIRDGFAVQAAIKAGFPIAIITGGKSEAVKKRFQKLGVTDIYMQVMDKVEAFNDFYYKYDINPADILYMGDDIPDYYVMTKVGLPTCPANAAEEIKTISEYISFVDGGNGCVRDVIEQVMKLQGKWIFE